MLVLSRKAGESVVLPGCEATITIVAIQGGRVRLGIAAPDKTPVHRAEVWSRICREAPTAETAAAAVGS